MDDIRINAEKRAANPSTVPAGAAFETERQKQKAALVRQLDELDPSRVRKISAYSETSEANRELRVAAYCRVSTDDIDQAISISLQMRQYKEKIQANLTHKYGCKNSVNTAKLVLHNRKSYNYPFVFILEKQDCFKL